MKVGNMATKPTLRTSPRAAMRERRPHLFSDSVPYEAHGPENSTLLAFALENIGANSQDHDFEIFCTKLAEFAVAPNIRPQTGPTGGGDSKSDSTTYPVDAESAARWYSAAPRQAPNGRWAFAYSSQKDWATKVRNDVKGILSVNPRPDHIYFITSQPTRDKRRQEIEAELMLSYGAPVTVLDRNWIVDKITTQGWWHLASYLKCPLENRKEVKLGPEDAKRSAELSALEDSLRKPQAMQTPLYDLSCDYMSAALLARGLERRREVIDGYFARATELARKSESERQQRWITYNWAWTAFWWYEDFVSFLSYSLEYFIGVEAMHDSDEVERVGNLVRLIRGLRCEPVHESRACELYDDIAPKYLTRLAELGADASRPTTAAVANLLLASWNLQEAFFASDEPGQDAALLTLADAFVVAQALGSIPLGHYVDLLLVFGEKGAMSERYDDVLDRLVKQHSERLAAENRASALLHRASQSLDAQDAVRALRFASMGRLLTSAEDPRLQNLASLVSAVAYQALGFLWASRAEYLYLLHALANNRQAGVKVPHMALRPALELCLCELRLGRPTCFLAAYELLALLAGANQPTDQEVEEIQQLDVFFGISILNVSISQLSTVVVLAATLERLDLTFAHACLRFAAGDTETAERTTGYRGEQLDAFFQSAATQPAASQMQHPWLMNDGSPQTLTVVIRGTAIRVSVDKVRESVIFAESLLTSLEALLCGTSFKDFVFHSASIQINVATGATQAPSLKMESRVLDVALPAQSGKWMHDNAGLLLVEFLRDIVAAVFGHFSMMKEPEVTLRALGEAGAIARSSVGAAIPNLLGNIGLDRYHMLADWPASAGLVVTRTSQPLHLVESTKQTPKELVLDLIDVAAWNAAKWRATAYILTRDGLEIHLIFENDSAAQQLFSGISEWCRRKKDPNCLAVLIVFDEQVRRYVVQVGPDMRAVLAGRGDENPGASEAMVVAGMRRMCFPLSDVSRRTLRSLAAGTVHGVAVAAAAFVAGAPVQIGAELPLASCRVFEAHSIPDDDVELQSLRRSLSDAVE